MVSDMVQNKKNRFFENSSYISARKSVCNYM